MNSAQSFSEVPEPDRMEQNQDLDDPEGVVASEVTGEDAEPTGSLPAVLEADSATWPNSRSRSDSATRTIPSSDDAAAQVLGCTAVVSRALRSSRAGPC